MRKFSPLLSLAILVPLAGCWQSTGPLYPEAAAITPFRSGTILDTDADGSGDTTTRNLILSGNVYHLISKDADSGKFSGYELRFFSIAGLPDGMFVFEAADAEDCATINSCDAADQDADYYYGLVKKTANGADDIEPDCDNDSALTAPLGIGSGSGISKKCIFGDRATLERALRALTGKDVQSHYTYEP